MLTKDRERLKFMKQLKVTNYCHKNGYLVGAEKTWPEDRATYCDGFGKIIGCNQIFCRKCLNFVRQWPGFGVLSNPWTLKKADFLNIYQIQNPGASPYLGKLFRWRVYSCLCWADQILCSQDLYKGYLEFDYWVCYGHKEKNK